jgi:outer membrane protein assembly factor BamB
MREAKMFAMAMIVLVLTCHAGNWPTWRGPSGAGVSSETELPVRWSDTENVAWKVQFQGLGVSSPVVWGDRVFVTSQIGGGESRSGPRLFQNGDAAAAGEKALGGGTTNSTAGSQSATFLITAFDYAGGKRLWEYRLESEGPLQAVHEKHNLASSSPVTDGRRVYAWFGTGQLVALDVDGRLVWKRNLALDVGSFDIQWGHSSSPALYGDTLILLSYEASGGSLVGLDSATGNIRWKTPAPKGVISYSTPCVVETSGPAEIIVNSSEGISGHSVVNGERLWFITEANRYPVPSAVQQDGVIYTSRGYRSGPFMAVRPGSKGDVSKTHVIWRVETGAPYVSSILYYQGLIYMTGDVGVVTVADGKTGERVWQERIGGVYTASPVAGDGKIYLFSEDGETTVLSAGRSPEVVARNKLTARQLASPAISGGRLFIRSDDTLFAIGK